MADLDYGKEIFVDDEGLISDLEDETIEDIEGTEAPEADAGTGHGSSSYEEDIEFADEDEEDDDEVSDDEDDIIDEDATTAEDEEDEPLFDNSDTLETIGSVSEDDNVIIMLVNGEPTVLGTVGGGDGQRVRIEELELGYAEIDELVATKASIQDLNAATARIGTIEADYLTASDMQAEEARIDNLLAGKVDTTVLNANYLTANQISANYAKLDASNITTATIRDAWVDELMVQTGLLANDGTVFSLDSIEVNANRITAGTLDVDRLIINQNGQKYLVSYDGQGAATYEKLDGNIIQDSTITADKILAGAITANKITTQNLVGTGGWINIANGTFNYTNANTGNFITWDGSHLRLNADNLLIDGSGITTIIEDTAPAVIESVITSKNKLHDTNWPLYDPNDYTSNFTRTTDATEGSFGEWKVYNYGDEDISVQSWYDTEEVGTGEDITIYGICYDGTVEGITFSRGGFYQDVELKANTDYVFSVYSYPSYYAYLDCKALRKSGDSYSVISGTGFDTKQSVDGWDGNITGTNAANRFYKTFNTGNYTNYRFRFYCGLDDSTFDTEEYASFVNKAQLEEGTTPTQWVDYSNIMPEITADKQGSTTTISVDGEPIATINDGTDGADGKSAYQSAVSGGYSGTEAQFNTDLADLPNKVSKTIIREYSSGVLVGKTSNTVGALVNANGSFDVVGVTWSGTTPTAGTSYSSFGANTIRIGTTNGINLNQSSSAITFKNGSTTIATMDATSSQAGAHSSTCQYAIKTNNSSIESHYFTSGSNKFGYTIIEGFGDYQGHAELTARRTSQTSAGAMASVSLDSATTSSSSSTRCNINSDEINLYSYNKGTTAVDIDGSLTTTSLTTSAFTNASTVFARTNHTFTISSIAKDGTTGATTKTFSKSGYYPVGIVGFQTGGGKVTFARMEITSASSGSVTITYNAYNGATTASGSLSASVAILWVKTS